MKQHRFRITVEHLEDAQGRPAAHAQPLVFETGNHDDILAIAARVRERGDFDERSAAALAVGMKLFGEVMLEQRGHPAFAALAPHFGEFMKAFKRGPTTFAATEVAGASSTGNPSGSVPLQGPDHIPVSGTSTTKR